jgi:hypothetical protein
MMMVGPDMLQEMEAMGKRAEQNLKMAQNRQKRYADQNKMHKEFNVGDHVYLWVKASKCSLKLGICTKLASRFCEPFHVLDFIGPVAYELALPKNLKFHNAFHKSLLNKYVHNPTYVIDWNLLQV